MRKWLVNNTSVYFFSSSSLLEHDFMKKTARKKRWSTRVSRLECTRSPRPVDRGRPQCPVSYPDNNSASHLFTSVFHQSAISLFRCASARPSCGFVILAVLHWYGLGVLPLSLLGGQQYSLEQRLSQHWQTNGCAVHGFSKFSVPFECLLLLLQYFARRIIW